MNHEWLYCDVIAGWQIVRCRWCGKHDKFRPMGHATTEPSGECPGSAFTRLLAMARSAAVPVGEGAETP